MNNFYIMQVESLLYDQSCVYQNFDPGDSDLYLNTLQTILIQDADLIGFNKVYRLDTS